MALEVEGVTAGYGSITVLRDVSLRVADGEILGVLGRNGMGKIDADPLHLRPHPGRAPARCASRAATSPACRRTSGPGSASPRSCRAAASSRA